jgi:hypothetical protein
MNSLSRFHWTIKGYPAIIHASNLVKERTMSSSHLSNLQVSQCQDTKVGFWKLLPGRALSLQPRQAGLLRVVQGQVWVTLGVSPHGARNELGDYFLRAGEQLAISPRQQVVMEPFDHAQEQAAFFDWTPSPVWERTTTAQDPGAVTQPLRELGQALGMVAMALLHLGTGLLAYGRQRLSGRPVVQAPQHCC